MLNQQCAIISVIDSYIKPLLSRVLLIDKLGICCGAIEADSLPSSCGKVQGDRFKLSIPYAKQNLSWTVFFDSQCPEMGPDFIFNDNTFLADMDVDTLSAKVPSLAKWNPNDVNALVNVLVELLSCYKHHQIQLLQKQGRLQLEYTMLIESTEVKLQDIEMILLPFSFIPTEAKFLICLPVDLSQLQIRPCESKSDIAMLLVTFSGTDWNHITPQLHFSKSLEMILGKTNTLHIPPFPPNQYLIHYVVKIKNYIAEKINSIVQSFEKKRQFISGILAKHGSCVIEYDSMNYSYVACLLNVNDFSFVLHIHLPFTFPFERPTVTVCSVYHMKSPNTVYTENVDFPYQSSWNPICMVEKLFNHIILICMDFKNNSVEHCS